VGIGEATSERKVPMFGINLLDKYVLAHTHFHFTPIKLRELAANAAEASFFPHPETSPPRRHRAASVISEPQSVHPSLPVKTLACLPSRDILPSISMWPYLLSSSQTRRLNKISVYADRGTSREQSRLLYMNPNALSLWREMGMPATVIGESHRPPRSAMLSFGMPFSE
jgi:hypothetical protein